MSAAALEATPRDAVGSTLARATLYRVLSILFRPPGERTARDAERLGASLAPNVGAPLIALARRAGADIPYLADLHHRTFTPAGPCPTGETDYSQNHLGGKGGMLGDVAAFYRAFDFDNGKELMESPDHVAVELSFASWLSLKEAYALSEGRSEAADICSAALATFRREHLDPLLHALAACLGERAPGTFYGDLGAATAALLPS